jgi:hypothetical protein
MNGAMHSSALCIMQLQGQQSFLGYEPESASGLELGFWIKTPKAPVKF